MRSLAPWLDVKHRVDDVKPTADVFALGKVLWWMVSGDAMLPFWYFDREQYNLERRFPNDPGVRWVNERPPAWRARKA